ncbi:MAG TPA: hypothetical protein ENN80_00535 [Candidatus Hydrogenedentes bacterium]|nr:hypothetical protein [Candidatus Hydrogenedentota bacterium]
MCKHRQIRLAVVCLGGLLMIAAAQSQEPTKQASTLYPPDIVERMRHNVANDPWAREVYDSVVQAAQPWMERSDDQLWALMFGPSITRSWMVWSNGHCPACGTDVPMYNWKMDALERPWKVQCPHCSALFPTNDFEAFYRSGLDERGLFEPGRADRSLLFNAEHSEAEDPLRGFGVDDGEGYVDGDKRWRFIGAYLIYGQWKQAIVAGIRILAAAHVLTGEPHYAHKAAVMLDRVADVYPSFDFGAQALVYEVKGARGYVSTWHDACEETREMVQAYDMIFEAIRDDKDLVAFLSAKAEACGIENPKASWLDIQRNIEGRILRDALNNRPKITTNYPRTEIAVAIILATLGWKEHEQPYWEVVDAMLKQATAVDGVTGEKGLAGYSCFTIRALALFLAEFSKAEPRFLAKVVERHPRLRETYRFFIDTRCLDQYYPLSGDTGSFAKPVGQYVGVQFLKPGLLDQSFSYWTFLPPSMYTFLWRLYELTGDEAYVQTLYDGNDRSLVGLPFDLYGENPEAFREQVAAVLERRGVEVDLGSVNKREWHLAILRSGQGVHRRALWLDYDSGGGHGHADGMNLGLFAKGLDLMPEFGYPPVQYGGWGSPRARWYTMTAAHNAVVVDGANTANGAGETTLWADGRVLHAMRANAPQLNQGRRFERTALLIDVSDEAFYVVDVFRVSGGSDHAKFFHSHFGEATPHGLALEPAADYGHGTHMRNFRMDAGVEPGWHVDWRVEDRYDLLPERAEVRLRYTDLTRDAQAGLAEGWIVAGSFDSTQELWIPRVVVRRQATEGEALESTFVAVIQPYETEPVGRTIRRLTPAGKDGTVLSDTHVALEVNLVDGRKDLLIARDSSASDLADVLLDADPELATDAELCLVRLAPDGTVAHAVLCNGSYAHCGNLHAELAAPAAFTEWPAGG